MATNDESSGRMEPSGGRTSTDAAWRGDTGPSPIPGVDWQTFRNFLIRALDGDDTVPSVMLQRVHAALQGGERNLEKRRQEWWREFFFREAIRESLQRLHDLIEAKKVERDQLAADIRDGELRLALIGRHIRAHEKAKEYRNIYGQYEVNERGELADADLEDMLRAWEKRTGKKLNRRNTESVWEALDEQRAIEEREAPEIAHEVEVKKEEFGKLNDEIGELEALEEEGEAALTNGEALDDINVRIQRELIAKGHGTDEQKQEIARRQGLSLSQDDDVFADIAAADDDLFGDEAGITGPFNQAVAGIPPAVEMAANNGLPPKGPAPNPNA